MPKRHQSTSAPQRTAPPHGMTPTILGRRDTVAVLIQAPFDAWYDQWMLQIDDTDDAVDPAGVDFFDDAVRMLESAAIGMAAAALRTHLDAHQADYAAAGVTVLVEPRALQDDALVCLLGVLETMHEEGEGWREDGERAFVETVAHDALAVAAYRAAESPFPAAVFAPGDPFFSAVDDSALLSDVTLADVQAHPEWYALVDVQVTTLYARVQLLGQASDDPAERALTA
jgi:hypothetical protein